MYVARATAHVSTSCWPVAPGAVCQAENCFDAFQLEVAITQKAHCRRIYDRKTNVSIIWPVIGITIVTSNNFHSKGYAIVP